MARKYVDCAAPGCTLRLSALEDEELETAVVDHAVTRHHAPDTPEFRERIRQAMQENEPRPGSPDDEPYLPPHGHKVLLENNRVRVLDVRIPPGERSEMHRHPPNVVYALSTAKVRFAFPDGTSREVDIKEGDLVWSEGGWHAVENIGATDDWGIIVELKR